MQRLHVRLHGLWRKQRGAVAAAFDETGAGRHRIAQQRIVGEHQRPFDQTVNCELMHVRIDFRNAAMNDREEHAVRRDRAIEQVVRRSRLRGARFEIRIGERSHHILGELRGKLIGRNRITGLEAPRRIRQWLGGGPCRHAACANDARDGEPAAEQRPAIEQAIAGDLFDGVLLLSICS